MRSFKILIHLVDSTSKEIFLEILFQISYSFEEILCKITNFEADNKEIKLENYLQWLFEIFNYRQFNHILCWTNLSLVNNLLLVSNLISITDNWVLNADVHVGYSLVRSKLICFDNYLHFITLQSDSTWHILNIIMNNVGQLYIGPTHNIWWTYICAV